MYLYETKLFKSIKLKTNFNLATCTAEGQPKKLFLTIYLYYCVTSRHYTVKF